MVHTCFDGRYLLFLMSLFSIYAGFMYNEMFSVSLSLFPSNWEYLASNGTPAINQTTMSLLRDGKPYQFGIDPAWRGTKNVLTYANSLKMKLSIIIGVTQMVVGIFLSAANAVHFRKKWSFLFEFLPQIIFMLSLFGYMCFLIVLKWLTNYNDALGQPCGPPNAPYLLNVMINIFLKFFGTVDCPLYSGQKTVQPLLLIVAVLMVPIMLLGKPIALYLENRRGYKHIDHGDGEHASSGSGGEHGGEEFDMSEIFVHQIIHTIEFVLGAVSNTASYLRLWALSLAHSELAVVFWDLTIILALEQSGFYFIFVGWSVWAGLTFGVLLIMESLSAFLHALRLHWVEFQNKFYFGDGRLFKPFSYGILLSGSDDT